MADAKKKPSKKVTPEEAAAANTKSVDDSVAAWRALQDAAASAGAPPEDLPTNARSHPPE